jgi:2-hydroxychromene-2-carboxylate isomerase
MNPHFPVNTLLLMRCAIAAERRGRLAAFIEAAMRAMWEEGVKLDDPDAARAVFDTAGLDGAGLIADAASEEAKAALLANTERAVNRGAFGVPTFFVGDQIFFGKDRLGEVEEAIMKAG